MKTSADKVRFGSIIRINDNAPFFEGREGVVAYVGADGVSVAVKNFEDYVSLKWNEFKLIRR